MPSSFVLSSSVMAPQAEVVTAGIVASVPSLDATVNEVPLAVTLRLVVTLVALAVLAATAVSRLAILGIATVPVNVGLAKGALVASAVST